MLLESALLVVYYYSLFPSHFLICVIALLYFI